MIEKETILDLVCENINIKKMQLRAIELISFIVEKHKIELTADDFIKCEKIKDDIKSKINYDKYWFIKNYRNEKQISVDDLVFNIEQDIKNYLILIFKEIKLEKLIKLVEI